MSERNTRRASLEAAEGKARELGRKIKKRMPEGWGFILILSSFDEDPEDRVMTYLASVERAGAIKMLRELADKIERAEPER